MNQTWTRRRFLGAASLALGCACLPGVSALAGEARLSFLAVGDWGQPSARDAAQKVATQMARTAATDGARFVLACGDNFYEKGVTSVDDALWTDAYEEVYDDPALEIPWYAVLGNHDYGADPDAELAYALRSDRWTMPARYYAQRFAVGDEELDVFFLDTEPLVSLNWANRWLMADVRAREQLHWLDDMLGASMASWRIVVGHHPVYSSGDHGNSSDLVERLAPILNRHGVQAYINGHDHNLEHVMTGGTHYLTSGAGSMTRPMGQRVEGSLFAAAALGFLSASLTPEALAFGFVGADGTRLHQATIARDGSLLESP